MGTSQATRASAATVVVLALAIVVVAPVARVLFPRLYLVGEGSSFVAAGLIGLVVYCAPILAWPFLRLPPRVSSLLGVIGVGGARLGVQLVHPVPAWLAVGATAAALVGTTCLILGLGGVRSLRVLPLALVAGLALDAAARIPTGSWELVWQAGPVPEAMAVGSVAALGIATVLAIRAPAVDRPGIAGAALRATGPFLMLQLVFLQNLGWAGSSVPAAFPAAVAIVLTGDVLALGVVTVMWVRGRPTSVGPAALLAAVTAIVAYALPGLRGSAAVVAVLVLQGVAAACLAIAAVRVETGAALRTLASMTVGAVGFLALAFLWQLDVVRPLPFARAAVPGLAGLWLGATAVASMGRGSAREGIARGALATSAVLVGMAVTVGTVTAIAWPRLLAAHRGGHEVTIVSFNVRGGLGEDGMLDADAIADSIAAAEPDVVLLQEVARGWPVFGQDDLLARLTQRLRLPYRFEPAADGQFGNVILSRLPMTPVAAGPLPEAGGSQRRSFLAVAVATARGPLLVADAHLESGSSAQIDALLAAVGEETPRTIAGDLNMKTTDTANVGRFVSAGLVDAEGASGDPCRTTSAAPTSSCDRPDWIWVSPDLKIARFATGTPSASDHLPVIVTVLMPA